jgi:hypothetical protein
MSQLSANRRLKHTKVTGSYKKPQRVATSDGWYVKEYTPPDTMFPIGNTTKEIDPMAQQKQRYFNTAVIHVDDDGNVTEVLKPKVRLLPWETVAAERALLLKVEGEFAADDKVGDLKVYCNPLF